MGEHDRKRDPSEELGSFFLGVRVKPSTPVNHNNVTSSDFNSWEILHNIQQNASETLYDQKILHNVQQYKLYSCRFPTFKSSIDFGFEPILE